MKRNAEVGDYRIVLDGKIYFIEKYKRVLFWSYWNKTYLWFRTLQEAKQKVKELKNTETHKSKVVWQERIDPLYDKPAAPPKRP